MKKVTRKEFLSLSTKWAAAAVLISSGWLKFLARKAHASANLPEGYDPLAHEFCMGIDIEKCIGCGRCAAACKTENKVSKKPFYFRTWIERYIVRDREEVIIDSPNGGVDGFPARAETRGADKTFFVPKICNHCTSSPCVPCCPVGASYHSPDGVVLIDQKTCIGCRFCIQACPYGCRYYNPVAQAAEKCTLCYHRITRGALPACVEVCPTGARLFGDLKDQNSPIHEFLARHKVQVLKPHLRTRPKVFYNGMDKAVR